ncbi:hypothetical protein [Pseudoglutamicibacter cumminsii]|uniref:YobI family P-loop NTPase n=1 Tax=Pseudoglutamicibacter cumminsii TaxID=156979 RepID=UPI00195EFE11|nr:hypothetical protein [Pseudoglutamicibacter cumminsii]MBM7795709.1 putative ribosome biogenesis GTPase RsgA [Pseudoglutamicibacter cumminsii]
MSEAKWNLVPLTPEYIENEHGGYVSELENALKNHEIRNIALSGPYGVGKSSILRELARRQKDRVMGLSLDLLNISLRKALKANLGLGKPRDIEER